MEKYSNNFCVGTYSVNEEEYIAILQSNIDYIDVITKKRFKLEELNSVNYVAPSFSLFKYLKKQFQRTRDTSSFKTLELYQTSLGASLLPLLRFFDIKYSECFEEKNTKETLDKVIAKCAKYLKRYADKETINAYVDQTRLYSNVVQIFCLLPEEIHSKITPFWHTIALELFSGRIVYPLTSGINTEVLNHCNEFKFNLAHYLSNKDEFNKIISKKKKQLVDQICANFKQQISVTIHKRIDTAKEVLEFERLSAEEENDLDLKTEVEIITEQIEKLERTIDKEIEELPTTVDIITWWPDLLYPAPKLVFEYTEEYFHLVHIQEYFLKEFLTNG